MVSSTAPPERLSLNGSGESHRLANVAPTRPHFPTHPETSSDEANKFALAGIGWTAEIGRDLQFDDPTGYGAAPVMVCASPLVHDTEVLGVGVKDQIPPVRIGRGVSRTSGM